MNVMDKLFKDVGVVKAGPITGILSTVIFFWYGVMLLLSVGLLVNHRLVHIDACRVFLPIYEYAKLPILLRGIDRKNFGFFCQFEVVWRVTFLFYVLCFAIFSLSLYVANLKGP